MKDLTSDQINSMISYYKESAYAQTNEITSIAKQVIEEGEELEDVENEIQKQIDCKLVGYEYIECDNQGSFHRHIWHKIENAPNEILFVQDSHGNRNYFGEDTMVFTEEEAQKNLDSLVNCYNCVDCKDCNHCSSCDSCKECNDCTSCTYCNSCTKCDHNKGCYSCESCDNCTYCNYCKKCTACTVCTFCNTCTFCNYCRTCNHCDYCYSCESCDNKSFQNNSIS